MKGRNSNVLSLTDDDNINMKLEETADFNNKFFTNIGSNLDWEYSGHDSEGSISDILTTPDDIIDVCKIININKASCIDNISSEILRDVFLARPEKLCALFNNCFAAATIPTARKYAKATPLPKSGNNQSVPTYRPISVLPLPSKLFEKIVHKIMYGLIYRTGRISARTLHCEDMYLFH